MIYSIKSLQMSVKDTLIIIIVAGLLLVGYVQWYVDRQLKRRLEFDLPLREVIAVTIWLKREYFLEALGLSGDEIDAAPDRVSAIRVRLQCWKSHYSGDIFFYNQVGSVIQERTIYEFPTASYQFPLGLGEGTLLRKDQDGEEPSFGWSSNERLEVLLSPSAFIVRAKDGRFKIKNSGSFFKSDVADLLIPTRESDLEPLEDSYGRDDPDFLLVTGQTRSYERDGRWARWQMSAVNPAPISWTTSSIDKKPLKLSD